MAYFTLLTSTAVTSETFKPVMDALTGQISVSSVVTLLAVVAGACVGFAFMWWGLRKSVRALMSAFKKGKVSL